MKKEKKIFAIIIVVILFLTISLSGCQASKGKVVVTVIASATLVQSSSNNTPVPNQIVEIEIRKYGSQEFKYTIATDDGGFVQCPPVVYNLYEGDEITIFYRVNGKSFRSLELLKFSDAYDTGEKAKVQEYTWGSHMTLWWEWFFE